MVLLDTLCPRYSCIIFISNFKVVLKVQNVCSLLTEPASHMNVYNSIEEDLPESKVL
jgi:hypothetical protein